MSTAAHHATPKRTCLDLDDPFGFRRQFRAAHVADHGDAALPPALAPAGRR
jgi:hypothetical protein